MEDSAIIIKAEKYLKDIAKRKLDFDGIQNFEIFKSVYFSLYDRLDHLQQMKNIMASQGYTAPFRSLNKYGVSFVEEVTVEERSEVSRHNKYFRTKAITKKNLLDRVSSAIDSHKIALGNLEEFANLKCDYCYKSLRINEYRQQDSRCTCNSKKFSFKINNDRTYRIEILPYLPYSGNYMVLTTRLSSWGRNAFKKVLKLLKQERRGVVKTISLVAKYKDENNRIIHKNLTFDSDHIDNYEEEIRKQFGSNVRIEMLRFHRSKPAIINDKHVRNALAIAYTQYSEKLASEIKDSLFKKRITDFKRLTLYEKDYEDVFLTKPDFIDNGDDLEKWRQLKFNEKLKKHGFIDKHGHLNRVLKRDLKTKENIEKILFTNIAPTLIIWDIFKYYLTTSANRRRILSGPFPYLRVEIDRKQREVFGLTHKKVIEILKEENNEKILAIDNMDLILYEKFKIEKLIKNSNIKINYTGLGPAIISLNSDIDLDLIGNAFNVNVSKIKKEINNIEHLRKPKTEKSKKFLEMIKK